MITISKVRDRAAAEVAKEALSSINIPVEIRLMGQNPYFGNASAEEWEVRVPDEHEEAALDELDRLAEEMEQAVYAEAGVPPPEDEADDLKASSDRPKKVSWALAISLLLPFPGGGCMYARANGPGLTILGVWLGLTLATIIGVQVPWGMQLWLGCNLVDLLLAPFFVARFNRRLDAARS
jgi:hypothetical protein